MAACERRHRSIAGMTTASGKLSDARYDRLFVHDRNKYKGMRTRMTSSLRMVEVIVFIFYFDHSYRWAMVGVIQLYMACELSKLARAP